MIIDGKKIAGEIAEKLKSRPAPKKILAAFLVGSADLPQTAVSENFLAQKEKTAAGLGVDFRIYRLSEKLSNDALRKEIGKIARQGVVGGVLVQLPLPEKFNRQAILNVVPPEKDVDVLSERASGAFYAGRGAVLPSSVGALQKILAAADFDLKGKKIAVIGLGFLIGKPIAVWLMGKAGNICLIDEGGDLSRVAMADLVISGAGRAGLLKPAMFKENALVVDFGCSFGEGKKLRGDFAADELGSREDISYTPTPGGAGPVLVAQLFENFYLLNGGKMR